MTILTGSLTSLRLSGSSLVQRKDTGAEVLMDMDFTQLPNQDITADQYNSIGGIDAYVITNGSPFFKVVNGEGISYADDGTGYAYVNWYYYTTFTGSTVNVADRIRVVAEFSGTRSDAAPSTNPDYFALTHTAPGQQILLTCRGPDSGNSNKFNYLNLWTMDNYGSNTQVVTDTGASTSVTGTIRLELDMSQGNAYTAADRNSSPAGLTNFPIPGEITPQGRLRMLSNTGMPKLISSYIAPFTSSNDAYVQIGFDANQGGLFSGSLRRLTIFRYGAD